MFDLKNVALFLLVFLLLKNLGIINWQNGRPSIDADGTRERIVNSIKGDDTDSSSPNEAQSAN